MALYKEIEQSNGIITNYHRIMSVNNITNKETQIIIYSYANKEKRTEENFITEDGEEIFNVVNSQSILKEYEEDFNVIKAYEYLKTLEKFKDAEDC